jgi:hypothetical protein
VRLGAAGEPVPAPRATTGTPCSAQILRMSTTWASVSGKATTSGSWRSAAMPSHS